MAYAVLNGTGMEYHHASMQIVEDGDGRCRFVWVTDAHPPDVIAKIAPLIAHGTQAFKRNLEAGAV